MSTLKDKAKDKVHAAAKAVKKASDKAIESQGDGSGWLWRTNQQRDVREAKNHTSL
jgi:hypothetical protein